MGYSDTSCLLRNWKDLCTKHVLTCTHSGLHQSQRQASSCSEHWLGHAVTDWCRTGLHCFIQLVAFDTLIQFAHSEWYSNLVHIYIQAERDPTPLHRAAKVLINLQSEDGEFPQQVSYNRSTEILTLMHRSISYAINMKLCSRCKMVGIFQIYMLLVS